MDPITAFNTKHCRRQSVTHSHSDHHASIHWLFFTSFHRRTYCFWHFASDSLGFQIHDMMSTFLTHRQSTWDSLGGYYLYLRVHTAGFAHVWCGSACKRVDNLTWFGFLPSILLPPTTVHFFFCTGHITLPRLTVLAMLQIAGFTCLQTAAYPAVVIYYDLLGLTCISIPPRSGGSLTLDLVVQPQNII